MILGILPVLILAAAFEIGGVAAVRHGLVRASWAWLLAGAAALVAYGLTVNVYRRLDFGPLMGTYIAIFFVVSLAISTMLFGERPSAALLAGGFLIVAGAVVIQAGIR